MHYLQCDWVTEHVPAVELVYRPADIWDVVLTHEPCFARSGLRRLARTLGWTPLHAAATAGNASLIRILVQKYKCDVLKPAADFWTPLHYAAAHNKVGNLFCWSLGWGRRPGSVDVKS